MVIILNFLNIMEDIFSVEYIIPSLIIDRVFNWLLPVIWVVSVHYCIVGPLLHLYPTIALWCVPFALFLPFSLPACPTDVPRPLQVFVSFHVCSPYPPCAKWVPFSFWGEILFTPLHLLMKIIWHHNFPPPILVMLVGPFSTTPLIIAHGIHIFAPQQSPSHRNIKFKGVEKQFG